MNVTRALVVPTPPIIAGTTVRVKWEVRPTQQPTPAVVLYVHVMIVCSVFCRCFGCRVQHEMAFQDEHGVALQHTVTIGHDAHVGKRGQTCESFDLSKRVVVDVTTVEEDACDLCFTLVVANACNFVVVVVVVIFGRC
jgi:hypothetical protein